jgi:uroporphyrinogen-III decarboxylase
MDTWLKIKHMFEYSPERVNKDEIEKAKGLQEKGAMIRADIPGGFDLPRELMGEEGVCVACYEDPELIHDILDTASDTSFRVLEEVSRYIRYDALFVHEDMAGKSGPLFGPAQVKEFIHPYYRRIWDMLSSRGTRLFAQDSDGDMKPVIDSFIEAGVNVFYPCEPAAGMDSVALRKKYGKQFAMIGGIDKHVLRRTKEEIKKELEYKLQPLMQGGGMCFGLDHRIPNGTPLENYRYYVKTAKEMLGIEGCEKSWARVVP